MNFVVQGRLVLLVAAAIVHPNSSFAVFQREQLAERLSSCPVIERVQCGTTDEFCKVIVGSFREIKGNLLDAFDEDRMIPQDIETFSTDMEFLWQAETRWIRANRSHYRDEMLPCLLGHWYAVEEDLVPREILAIYLLKHFFEEQARNDRNARNIEEFLIREANYTEDEVRLIFKKPDDVTEFDRIFSERLYLN